MRKVRHKQIIVTLWLMTFIGQALASASLCCEAQTFSNNQATQLVQQVRGVNDLYVIDIAIFSAGLTASKLEAVGIDHAQHQKSQSALDTSHVTSPCITDCECSMSGCTPALLSASQAEFDLDFIDSANAYKSLPQDRLITALYRPPISR